MHRFILLLTVSAMLAACSSDPDAQQIIDDAIEKAGGERYRHSLITFDFRDHSYSIRRKGGLYAYTRYSYPAADTVIKDVVHNYGFQRTLNDSMISVPDSMVPRYTASINSVVYFISLPFGLNDPAVNKERMGSSTIEGRDHWKIKVWFDEEGGGKDHDDIFYYWIDKETLSLNYLAYSYNADGGGMRFRKAVNPRVIEGIRVVDYINFQPASEGIELDSMDAAFGAGKVDVLSRIENDNVTISLLEE